MVNEQPNNLMDNETSSTPIEETPPTFTPSPAEPVIETSLSYTTEEEVTPLFPEVDITPSSRGAAKKPAYQARYAELPDDLDKIFDLKDVVELNEYTPDQRKALEAKYEETMKVFRGGEIVEGKIVDIKQGEVIVNIGFKSDGAIPLAEFDNSLDLKVGDLIEVCIENIEDKSGSLRLSRKKAEFIRTWEKIIDLYNTGEMVEATISRRIKGGMVVTLFGVEAFLPGSQIDVHPVRDFDALVGAAMDFRVIKINHQRKNVVLSHKVLIEESLREIRQNVLSELEVGQVVEGTVKNITDFGVFVDLGGVDGLLHITDLSWGRVTHPGEIVKLDEKIKVKVLQYDKDKQRISLGLKQLNEPNWEEIEHRYPLHSKHKGKVVAIVKYGAFIELEPGVEGLVHISEMSWTQHIKHPSQMVTVGGDIDIVILSFDRENRKISLGMKQVDEDPWERLEKVYIPLTRHKGTVRDLVPFGAFVELEPGIDGLIHISDLSWTRKVRHPGEIVKKNQEIDVVILSFDRNERRIALGFKQLDNDPWDSFEKEYQIRHRTEGSVIRVLEKGVVVMLPLGVEGFVPNSQLGRSISGDNKRSIQEGDNLALEVIEFDKGNHRIVLSHSLIEREKEKSGAYRVGEGTEESALASALRESGTATEVVPSGKHGRKRGRGDRGDKGDRPERSEKPKTVEVIPDNIFADPVVVEVASEPVVAETPEPPVVVDVTPIEIPDSAPTAPPAEEEKA